LPGAFAFLPNGDMLVTEAPGIGSAELEWGNCYRQQSPLSVTASGEGGLLSIATPQIASNRLFYLYYTADGNGS